jgi:glutamate-5-semialdehyde dehydrogenase
MRLNVGLLRGELLKLIFINHYNRNLDMSIKEIALAAKKASRFLAGTKSDVKNAALSAISKALQDNSDAIIEANSKDLERAETENLGKALLKRLRFDGEKIADVCHGIDSLIGLDDPVGKTISATELDAGLELFKVSCPIGVIGVIFESRPDALVQIATLCLKSGNAVLLKGGSEAAETNRILANIISKAGQSAGISDGWLGLMETRSDVAAILELNDSIDLIVPRGSNEFVQHIMKNTTIPVMGHADGICHVYVDAEADVEMAVNIAFDSKCQYCSVCNALETLLVHKDIAAEFLPKATAIFEAKGVELRGCEKTLKLIRINAATEADWKTEYLEDILAIKIVDSLDAGIDHINTYGSGHTDVIVTKNAANAAKFMDLVDSGDVFFNCSSRFSDGFRFGLGAEVGISTNKIHARGPVGMEGLLIYKWRMIGDGHIVSDYAGGGKNFTHKKIDKEYKI